MFILLKADVIILLRWEATEIWVLVRPCIPSAPEVLLELVECLLLTALKRDPARRCGQHLGVVHDFTVALRVVLRSFFLDGMRRCSAPLFSV